MSRQNYAFQNLTISLPSDEQNMSNVNDADMRISL